MAVTINYEQIRITELDSYLFGQGTHYEIYNKMGAHIAKKDGKPGVYFAVWAPAAKDVYVIGEFNDWKAYGYDMKKISDGGIYELFIEGAKAGQMYKYLIISQSGEAIYKADPYANAAQLRPETASIITDLNGFKWTDSVWVEHKKKENHLKSAMSIYECHLGSWKKQEDGTEDGYMNYRDIAPDLAKYVSDMGYTHIELMGIAEYPYDGSWGYQVTGYYAPTSRYGTPSDFMAFVDKLHGEGIGVILDWVPSNFPTDDFGLARFDGSPLYESNDPKTSKRDSWGTCLFNYARFEVTSFLVSCAMFWLDKYHIDGLRIGALSSMLYLDYGKTEGEWEPNKFGGKENLDAVDFVKRLNTAVHMYHPDVMMFAEENTSWPKLTHKIEDGGLGFDFKWNMGWMKDMLHYMSLNSMWRPFNHDSLTFSFYYAFSEKFLLPISHDEVSHGKGSLIKQMPGKYDEQFAGVRAFITYMYAHPGKKLVFMGTEIGQFDEWNHEEAIQWDLLEFEKHKKLRTFFKELNKFYLDCKPLYELDTVWKGFDWIHHDDYTNSVIAFKRTDKNGDEIVSVCNFQPIRRDEYCIGVPKYGLYDEVFNSDEERFGGSGVVNGNNIKTEVMKIHGFDQGLSLTLPPLSVIYLRCTKELEPDEAQKEN